MFAAGLLSPFELREEDARHPHVRCTIRHRSFAVDQANPPVSFVGCGNAHRLDQMLAADARRREKLEAETHAFEVTPFELMQHKRCPVCGEEEHQWWDSDDACDGIGWGVYREIVMALSRWSHRVFNDPTHSRVAKANRGRCHLDHRCSLFTAFQAQVPEWVMAAPFNLQWITGSANSRKGTRDEFGVDELHRRYHVFESNAIWQAMLERYRTTGTSAGDEVNRLPRGVTREERQRRILATMEGVGELWKSGLSITAMAQRLGWSRPTMTTRLQRHRDLVPDSWVHSPVNAGQRLPDGNDPVRQTESQTGDGES